MCFLLYSWLTLLLVGCFSGQGYRKKNSVIHHSMSKPWLWVDRCTWRKRCNYKITDNKTIYDTIHRNIVVLNKNAYFTSILTNIYITVQVWGIPKVVTHWQCLSNFAFKSHHLNPLLSLLIVFSYSTVCM